VTTPHYQDDKVTLYHGDCRAIREWLSADVLVTDPPYGVGYSALGIGHGRVGVSRQHRPIANDHDFTTAAAAIESWGAKSMAVFASHASLPETLAAVRSLLARVRIATWHKVNMVGSAPGNPWLSDVEFVVMGVDAYPKDPTSGVISTRANVGNPDWSTRTDAYLHPTQKATSGMEAVVRAMPAGTIADPFAGSGSTLVAARNLGRHAIGVELVEKYCEVAARRLAQDCLTLGDAS
jgi:site-specific DNA-methyltransferase (adenine-specific)